MTAVKTKNRGVESPHSKMPEDRWISDSMAELAQGLLSRMKNPGTFDPGIPNLTIYRFDKPTVPTGYLLEPSLCLILQGQKRVILGQDDFTYGPTGFFITSVDLPVIAQILDATPSKPYVGLVLKLDRMQINRLVLEAPLPPMKAPRTGKAIEIGSLSPRLFEAVARLVGLLDEPELIPVLSPLIQQELMLRMMLLDCGAKIRQIATGGSPTHQISRAIDWMKTNLEEKLRIEDLAKRAGMSVSTLHHHFRALTSLSPLQFQKNLRLNEARRLMLNHRMDAASAALEVGYESPSQFSREYSRLFGEPPLRDIKKLAVE